MGAKDLSLHFTMTGIIWTADIKSCVSLHYRPGGNLVGIWLCAQILLQYNGTEGWEKWDQTRCISKKFD